jgi:hypothetical protein
MIAVIIRGRRIYQSTFRSINVIDNSESSGQQNVLYDMFEEDIPCSEHVTIPADSVGSSTDIADDCNI